jgi:hypothetical protein
MKKAAQRTEVLVVIDMQAGFTGAQNESLIERIQDEARAVVGRGGRVLTTCFDGSGTLTVELPGAPSIWKDRDCGSDEIYAWLVGAGLISSNLRIRVCGVNLSACVIKTAIGLAERLHNEHAMCDHVVVEASLCGDDARFKVRILP